MKGALAFVIFWVSVLNAGTEVVPTGYVIAEDSLSPDGRYGVIVPVREKVDDPRNCLIEIKTGRVVAELKAQTSWNVANHESILPVQWAEDGSWFLWEVEGKWFPHALTLVRLEEGKVAWQVDVLSEAQRAILTRTRKIAPREYALAQRANAGNGSAYPDGFSVDVAVKGPMGLPMKFVVALTSNPKGITGHPTLESHMETVVEKDGTFRVTEFALGAGESAHF